jgi:hypothetical protein
VVKATNGQIGPERAALVAVAVNQHLMGCHQAVNAIFPAWAQGRMNKIVERESHGIPTAKNRSSSASGCAQLLVIHAKRFRKLGYSWEHDRFRAYPNIRVAYDLWAEQGWAPWRLTA